MTWSDPADFSIRLVPEQLSGAAVSTPTFRWQSDKDAAGYEIVIKTADGNRLTAEVQSTTFVPDLALPAGNSQWWVRAFDDAGRRGLWSSRSSVLIGAAPDLTVIPPATAGDPLRFSWNTIPEANRYVLAITDTQGIPRHIDIPDGPTVIPGCQLDRTAEVLI